jgi:CheY-like chemotaxis protein
MDGYEVARRLRAIPEAKSAVLIALTGYGREQDVVHAKKAGFDHHMIKPVDTSYLEAPIEKAALEEIRS